MRSFPSSFACVSALVLLLAAGASASAQDTRAAAIAAQQEKKAAGLRTYEPGRGERTFLAVKREFIDEPSGFYPFFGSVYPGGGFTLGAGVRQFYGDRTHWDVNGLYSLKNYKFLELSTDSWGHGGGRLDLHVRAGWRDATQVAFYGLGNDTPELRTDFGMKQAYGGADIRLRPVSFLVFGASATYEDFTIEEGTGRAPSIETIFTPDTAPGLGVSPTYIHSVASAGIDWRPAAGYARRGGLYEVRYHNYADRGDTFTFDRLDAEIVQHLPILRENWVISLHGEVQTTLDDDDVVPFFLLPSLGSGSTLRSYPSWRFRDRHSILVQGEFRWIPNRLGLDMAIFYDAGKVTSRRRDLDLDGLRNSVGVGVRFHGPMATPLRIELARGKEGMQLVFAGNAAF